MPEKEHIGGDDELDRALSAYYNGTDVNVVIGLRAEAKEGEKIGTQLSQHSEVLDCFMVTGDLDLMVRCRFSTYAEFKDFIVNVIGNLKGIRDSQSMMIVTAYKEGGRRL